MMNVRRPKFPMRPVVATPTPNEVMDETLSVSTNLQSMLDILKNLSAHEAESSLNCLEKEDTPVVALKRKEIVKNLQQTLQNLTRKCSNIQSESHNALTRLLFSGITASGDT